MKTCFRETFESPYAEHADRIGQRFTVIALIVAPEQGYDDEVLPLYRIRFCDGSEIEALPEEIEVPS